MKTDIEIAQEAEMMPIKNVAEQLGITEDDIELYGKYKAKISNEYYEKIKDNEDGKLILVTAINPTPAGEGKTTVTKQLSRLENHHLDHVLVLKVEQQVADMHRLYQWKI